MAVWGEYTPTKWVMQQHAQSLADRHNIELFIDPKMNPMESSVSLRSSDQKMVVVIAGVWDEVTYAVALHEMGHIAAPRAAQLIELADAERRRDVHRFISIKREEEEMAWTWARVNAVQWTPMMQAVMDMGLQSYQYDAAHLLEMIRHKGWQ